MLGRSSSTALDSRPALSLQLQIPEKLEQARPGGRAAGEGARPTGVNLTIVEDY
jgi:hypothetical protein